VFAVEYLV